MPPLFLNHPVNIAFIKRSQASWNDCAWLQMLSPARVRNFKLFA